MRWHVRNISDLELVRTGPQEVVIDEVCRVHISRVGMKMLDVLEQPRIFDGASIRHTFRVRLVAAW